MRNFFPLLILASSSWAQFDLHQKIEPAGLGNHDHFGSAVAADHDWIVMSATDDDDAGADVGAIYAIDQPGGNTIIKLLPVGATPNAQIGGDVDVAFDRAVAGMRSIGTGPRTVYVFDLNAGTQLHAITSPGTDDLFGVSVAISQQFILVGAPGDDDVAPESGAVYVYDTVTGALLFKRKAETPRTHGSYGAAVDLASNIAVVGEPGIFNSVEGEVHLIDCTVNVPAGSIQSPCSCVGGFGNQVAMDGPWIVVQSPGDRKVYRFHINGGQPLVLFPPAPSAGFGYGLDIYGSRIAVGHQDTFGMGNVYIFSNDDGRLIDRITPNDLGTGDLYGQKVAVNVWGATAGAPGHDGTTASTGAVYHWRFSGCPVNRYCSPGYINSTGYSAFLDADSCQLGQPLEIRCTNLPPNRFGYLLVGQGNQAVIPPGGSPFGLMCLGGAPIGRYQADVGFSGTTREITTDVVFGASGGGGGDLPGTIGGSIQPGDTWNFQFWYREVGGTSAFSDAITIEFD